ncbi:MAG: MFS transporter [Candidatus Kapaibacteriales bacterium]
MAIGREMRVTLVLAILLFTNIVDFMIIMPLSDLLIKDLGLSASQFSHVVASYSISAFLSGILVSTFIDRFDKKKLLIGIYTGFLIGTTLCGLSETYITLVGSRFLTGIFGGVMGALCFTIISDIVPVERRSTAMGYMTAAFSLASVAGVPLGLQIAAMYRWETPFFFIVGFGLLVFILVFLFIPSIPPSKENLEGKDRFLALRNLFTRKNQIIALSFMLLLVLGQFTVIPFITPYLTGNVGHSFEWIPLVYVVGGICTFISSPLVGKAADKLGRKKVFLFMALISIIPLLFQTNVLYVQDFFGEVTNPFITLTASGLFFIFISGRMVPTNSLMTSVVSPENRGGFMSLTSSFQQLGAGLASLIAGWIIVVPEGEGQPIENYGIVGLVAVGFTLLAILLSFKLKTVEGN